MAAQEKSSQEGQNEFYGFFPTVANKTYTCPVKNQAPPSITSVWETKVLLRVGLWSSASLIKEETLLSALPSIFHFRNSITPLGKKKKKPQGKTVKHLSYTISSEPDSMFYKVFVTISFLAVFFKLSFQILFLQSSVSVISVSLFFGEGPLHTSRYKKFRRRDSLIC